MKRTPILHPILFAAFPVLFLFSRNLAGYRPGEIVWSLVVPVALAAAIWVILSLVLRNARKAAILVSLASLIFLSFGHLRSALSSIGVGGRGLEYGPEAFLIPPLAVGFTVAAYYTVKTKSPLSNLTKILNLVSAFLVVFCLVKIGAFLYRTRDARRFAARYGPIEVAAITPEQAATLPKIYYIILDGYGRSDNLREIYDYDNSAFLDALRSRGFYVAARSHSNYSHTPLCLSSTLNMEYLDHLSRIVGRKTTTQEPLRRMIEHSAVRRFLAERGYVFVCFSSGYFATQVEDADVYMTQQRQSEFERGLLGTTAVATARRQRAGDQARIKYILEKLPEPASYPAPAFVLAHIVAPHPPFVFTSDGEDIGDEEYFFLDSANHLIRKGKLTRSQYMERYIGQMKFIEKAITECIDRIIADSHIPPIIVLQGDHGAGAFLHHESIEGTYLQDRLSILNAYYLPGGADGLYDSITPVNTFRLILNRYYGTDMPLLEDRSYYATATHPYDHTDVTDRLGDAQDRARYERLRNMDYYPDDIEVDARGPDYMP